MIVSNSFRLPGFGVMPFLNRVAENHFPLESTDLTYVQADSVCCRMASPRQILASTRSIRVLRYGFQTRLFRLKKITVGNIRHEHAAGAVRDRELGTSCHEHRLRSDSAGPEDRQLVRVNGHGVSEVRLRQVGDSNLFRNAKVNRGSVHGWKT